MKIVILLYDPELKKHLTNKPNSPQPTSASVLVLLSHVLQIRRFRVLVDCAAFQGILLGQHLVSALLSTCNPVVHASPQQVSTAASQKKETTSNTVILWPLLLVSNSARLWWLKFCTLRRLSPLLAPKILNQYHHVKLFEHFRCLAHYQS